jgi:NAD(P)-dependent dehydrogenase (short-subunit alcohol dehydrogenase family)
MTTKQLDGKVAVVTGAARGLGKAIALGLAEAGASVFATDVLDAVEATAGAITAAGGMAASFTADLRNVANVAAVFSHAVERFGTVDILVNVAGLQTTTATVDYTEEIWDLHTDVNYNAVFFCSQAAAKIMIPKGRGKIVNVASTSAFVSSRNAKVAYDSTKGAVRQLTVSMGAELARKGINVNAIAPGTMLTDMTARILATPEQRAATLLRIPLGRIGEPADVVGPVLFLCSPASDYVVGHTLVVDGGWLL